MPNAHSAQPTVRDLWSLLDSGDLWNHHENSADCALAVCEQRLERARRAGIEVSASSYFAFLSRTRSAMGQGSLAKAG